MFDDYFEVFLADTKEGREVHYNIRYQVYCEELGYEDTSKFPDQLEFDKWDPQDDEDQRSVLFLVRLKHTKQWIAAIRIAHHNGEMIPLQEVTSVDHEIGNSAVEISRLCIVKEIRVPYTQTSYGIDENDLSNNQLAIKDDSDEKIQMFYSNPKIKSTIIWGLFNATMQYIADNKIKKAYLLTNRALVRVLGRQGVVVDKVGDTFEHRGKRSPYRFDVQEILTKPIWSTFKKSYSMYSELSGSSAAKRWG